METFKMVYELKKRHEKTWRGESEPYWFARLVEEIGELGGALVGNHEHTPDYELSQIAAIVLNWLEMRAGNKGDYRRARGVVPWREGDPKPEEVIAKGRGRRVGDADSDTDDLTAGPTAHPAST